MKRDVKGGRLGMFLSLTADGWGVAPDENRKDDAGASRSTAAASRDKIIFLDMARFKHYISW